MKPRPHYFFKLGLATALAYLACTALGSEYPFYAVISVIVVLQPTLGTTWQSSLRRIGGSLVGIPLGGLLAMAHVNTALALGVGVATTVWICTRLSLRDGVAVSAFALASIVVNHPSEPWLFAAHRLLDTLVGIAIAVAVNRLLWPPRAGLRLEAMLLASFPHSAALLETLVDSYLGAAPYDRQTVEKLREPLRVVPIEGPSLWREARAEGGHERWTDEGSEFLIKRLREHMLALDEAAGEAGEDPLPRPCAPELRRLGELCARAWRGLGKERVDAEGLERASAALHEAVANVDELAVPALMRLFAVAYNLRTIESKLVQLDRQ